MGWREKSTLYMVGMGVRWGCGAGELRRLRATRQRDLPRVRRRFPYYMSLSIPGSLAAATASAACCPRSSQTPLRLRELPPAAVQPDNVTCPSAARRPRSTKHDHSCPNRLNTAATCASHSTRTSSKICPKIPAAVSALCVKLRPRQMIRCAKTSTHTAFTSSGKT